MQVLLFFISFNMYVCDQFYRKWYAGPLPQHFPYSLPPSSLFLSLAPFIFSPPPLNSLTDLRFLLPDFSDSFILLSACSFHNKRQGCRACKISLSSNPRYSSLCCIHLMDREEKVQIPARFKTAESERFPAQHAI